MNDNDKGYFEDLEINDLNMELLTALKRDWHTLSRICRQSLSKARRSSYFSSAPSN